MPIEPVRPRTKREEEEVEEGVEEVEVEVSTSSPPLPSSFPIFSASFFARLDI
jgi:hypothetical protein